ncbi:MAG: DUF1398 domain-containing protein [Methylobacter sp.]|nr:MAG: DUF1398 domain-containing protein [Methylobacter sp.]
MDNSVASAIRETFNRSNDGRIHFGQVVGNLLDAGVESYHVDYRSCRATYFLPCGETLTLDMEAPDVGIAKEFSVSAIQSAILAAQRGEVMYPEFKKLSQAGGCVGYTVWLAGRQVAYYGRKGETHVEKFPN